MVQLSTNKQMNNFLKTAKLYKVFLAYFLMFISFMCIMNCIVIFNFCIDNIIIMVVASLIVSSMCVSLVKDSRYEREIDEKLDKLFEDVTNATTSQQLISIKTNLDNVGLVRKDSYNIVNQLIENRLKYEFKIR